MLSVRFQASSVPDTFHHGSQVARSPAPLYRSEWPHQHRVSETGLYGVALDLASPGPPFFLSFLRHMKQLCLIPVFCGRRFFPLLHDADSEERMSARC